MYETRNHWSTLRGQSLDLNVLPTKPFGIHTAQTWGQIAAYFDLIDAYGVDLFVEVGTDQGGLAAMMIGYAYLNPEFRFIGVEKIGYVVKDPVRMCTLPNVHVFLSDCFDRLTVDTIHALINNSRRTLVLCDGGNKVKELRQYMSLLKPLDLITVHDWGFEINEVDIPVRMNEMFDRIHDYENVGLPVWQRKLLLSGRSTSGSTSAGSVRGTNGLIGS